MRIVWIGFHEEGVPAFWRLLEKGIKIEAFLTLSEEKLRLKSAYSTKYADLCRTYGIAVYPVAGIKGEEAYRLLRSLRPDLLIVLGWSEILPERLLKIPSIGTVGTHASLLPHNRGSAPVNWAIIRGETRGGNTLMWLSPEVDAGEIISQMEFPITMYDTCRSVYEKVAETNAQMLEERVRQLAEEEESRRGGRSETGEEPRMARGKHKEQARRAPDREETRSKAEQERNEAQENAASNGAGEPLLPRRRPQDGLIDWALPAKQIYDFVRALTRPYPGAFTYFHNKRMFIWKCALLAHLETGMPPGTILGRVYSPEPAGCGLAVAAGQGILIVHEMEHAGGIVSGKRLHEAEWEGRFQNAQSIDCGSAPGR